MISRQPSRGVRSPFGIADRYSASDYDPATRAAQSGANTQVTSRSSVVARVLSLVRAAGYDQWANVIAAQYDSAGWVPAGALSEGQALAFLLDTAIAVQAPYPVLEIIEETMPASWAPSLAGFFGATGRTTSGWTVPGVQNLPWSTRRLYRTTAYLLRAGIDGNTSSAARKAVDLTLRGQSSNPKDVAESAQAIQTSGRLLAKELEIAGLPTAAKSVLAGKVLASQTGGTVTTSGVVQSGTGWLAGLFGDVSRQTVRSAAIAVGTVAVIGAGYYLVLPVLASRRRTTA